MRHLNEHKKGLTGMRLAVMQPYFFPYIGYYVVMNQVDRYVYLDNVQYIRRGWINRNRLLRNNGGWKYFNVPVAKAHRSALINEITIAEDVFWRKNIFQSLETYKNAPYYAETISLVRKALAYSGNSLSELNIHVDDIICGYLGIGTEREELSKMDISYDAPAMPDEWGLNVCLALGAAEYLNAPGGKSFYDAEKYKAHGISIKFVQANLYPYNQLSASNFEAGLSIIDVLMFNSREATKKMLDDFAFI